MSSIKSTVTEILWNSLEHTRPSQLDSESGSPGLRPRYSVKLSGNWQESRSWPIRNSHYKAFDQSESLLTWGHGTLWPMLYHELYVYITLPWNEMTFLKKIYKSPSGNRRTARGRTHKTPTCSKRTLSKKCFKSLCDSRWPSWVILSPLKKSKVHKPKP